jgi:hypothetical protein
MNMNSESQRMTKDANWEFLFETEQRENHKSYIVKYYVNHKMNQIKEVGGCNENIISCPIDLDYVICRYLVKGDSNVFIKNRLLRVINIMFTKGCNKCPYWNEWHQKSDDIRKYYLSKGIIPKSSFFPARIIDTHYYVYKAYAVKDLVGEL